MTILVSWGIAVHRGAHKRDDTRRARELAQSFFATYRKLTAVTSQQFEQTRNCSL